MFENTHNCKEYLFAMEFFENFKCTDWPPYDLVSIKVNNTTVHWYIRRIIQMEYIFVHFTQILALYLMQFLIFNVHTAKFQDVKPVFFLKLWYCDFLLHGWSQRTLVRIISVGTEFICQNLSPNMASCQEILFLRNAMLK